mmetsp:Transcript_18659/g.56350  ORF Transcript_18659/g.56350 Transcript_18659/m.56350 type:complete len:208 (+) Transcript_18659:222-845(+)
METTSAPRRAFLAILRERARASHISGDAPSRWPARAQRGSAPLRLSCARIPPPGGSVADHPFGCAVDHHARISPRTTRRLTDGRDTASPSRLRVHGLLSCWQEARHGWTRPTRGRPVTATIHAAHRRATPAFKCGARWHGASLSCVDTLLGGARVEVVTRQHGHRCSRSTALGTGGVGCRSPAPFKYRARACNGLRDSGGSGRRRDD